MKASGTIGILVAANAIAWAWAFILFAGHPLLLGTALLAYSLGLRHAIDADHIAAIDNVTCKLLRTGVKPVNVGVFFAMGHSVVVLLAATGFAGVAALLTVNFAALRSFGSTLGTIVSIVVLISLAAMNLFVLRGVWHAYRNVRRGGAYVDEELDVLVSRRGLTIQFLRPAFGLITRSWHMLPLGFLFGLGFETATEVSLLGLSAAEAQRGGSFAVILVFPALFAAGMMLVDSTDGLLMLRAYDWAFIKPMSKMYYNLTITSISIGVAVFIAGIESLGLIESIVPRHESFWLAVRFLNGNFSALGLVVVAAFIFAWAVSMTIYRLSDLENADVVLGAATNVTGNATSR